MELTNCQNPRRKNYQKQQGVLLSHAPPADVNDQFKKVFWKSEKRRTREEKIIITTMRCAICSHCVENENGIRVKL